VKPVFSCAGEFGEGEFCWERKTETTRSWQDAAYIDGAASDGLPFDLALIRHPWLPPRSQRCTDHPSRISLQGGHQRSLRGRFRTQVPISPCATRCGRRPGILWSCHPWLVMPTWLEVGAGPMYARTHMRAHALVSVGVLTAMLVFPMRRPRPVAHQQVRCQRGHAQLGKRGGRVGDGRLDQDCSGLARGGSIGGYFHLE
jgi:hypothetical protein